MNVPPALAAAGDVAAAEVEAEAVNRGPIVTSGESDEGVLDDDEEDPRTSQDDDDVDSDDALVPGDHHGAGHASSSQQQEPQQPHDEYLYDDQADERDEAYVNQHLRSAGITIRQQQQQQQQQRRDKDKNLKYNKTSADADNESNQNNHNSSNRDDDNQKKQQQQKQPKKAKNSDAVLSCPCCFTTVCMDCQRHERFQNQYRAMFVMNILVQWDHLLAYNNVTKRLEPTSATTTTATATARTTTTMTNTSITTLQSGKQQKAHAAAAAAANTDTDDDIIYHVVCCANCQTQVAALDMTEEVYHFFGCIASS